MPFIQIPTIVLPVLHPLGTETETIADILEHTSLEIAFLSDASLMQHPGDKQLHILAQEVVAAGIPGNLWVWIEESPYPSSVSPSYWAAIGGGGGALPPVAPQIIELGTGVNGAVHTMTVPWRSHSPFVRVVVQTPVLVATAVWAVQVMLSGKGD